jgi:hypothetical protein
MQKTREVEILLSGDDLIAADIKPTEYVRRMKKLRQQGNLPKSFVNWLTTVDEIYRTRFRNGGVANYVTEKHLYLGFRNKLSPIAFVASRVYATRTK